MKYKRQLLVGMIAIALLTGNSSAFAEDDFISNSKIDQYQSQLQMKSYDKSLDDTEQVVLKKHKKSLKIHRE